MTSPVLGYDTYASNADLIVAAAHLGWLRASWKTLDPTYGKGTFWKRWRPDMLVGTDLATGKGLTGTADFTCLPFADQCFDAVVFDPPYKLNGTPDPVVDERYGVDGRVPWQDRITLMHDGTVECARVARGMLLVKCQDQVVSGKVRWQTDLVTAWAESHGFGKVDRLDMRSYRKQPEERDCVQRHARSMSSTLLVFKRGHTSLT